MTVNRLEQTAADGASGAEADVRLPRRQHVGWWLVVALVLVAVAMLVHMLVSNKNLQWSVVWHYFTSTEILKGLWMTVRLTVFAMLGGIGIGVLIAVMRLSPIKVLSSAAWAFTWFFRGTPLLVQIIFWYNLAALVPTISIGIPFGPSFASWKVNTLITPFVAALVSLALNEGAYMSEIVRGGILSVEHGQEEAAIALGMRRGRIMRRIILPQAMRVIVPPTGNQVISMLKSSSLVSVTSLPELLYSAQLIYQRTFQTIPLLIVASLWYLIVTTVLSIGQYYLERRFSRGSHRSLPPTPLQQLRKRIAALTSTAQARTQVGT